MYKMKLASKRVVAGILLAASVSSMTTTANAALFVNDEPRLSNVPITSSFYKYAVYLDRFDSLERDNNFNGTITAKEYADTFNCIIVDTAIDVPDELENSNITYRDLVNYNYDYLSKHSTFNIDTYKKYKGIDEISNSDLLYSIGILDKKLTDSDMDTEVTYEEAMKSMIAVINITGYDMLDFIFEFEDKQGDANVNPFIKLSEKYNNNTMTINDMCEKIKVAVSESQWIGFEGYGAIATYDDLLTALYGYLDEYWVFGIDYLGNIKYNLIDSVILSKEEYSYLENNKDKNVEQSVLDIITSRLVEFKKDMRRDKVYTAEDVISFTFNYMAITDGFMSEASSRIGYWMGKLNPINVEYYKTVDDIGVALHESQHELSALKSNIYSGHRITSDGYYVDYSREPNEYYWYDLDSDSWLTSDLNNAVMPYSSTLVRKNATDEVKDTSLYKTYVNSSYLVSNKWGMPGILMEACSNNIDTYTMYTCYNLGKFNNVTSVDPEATETLFWMAYILSYLSEYQDYSSKGYEKLISDDIFITLASNILIDGYKGINTYTCSMYYKYEAFLDWLNQEELQDQLIMLIAKDIENDGIDEITATEEVK